MNRDFKFDVGHGAETCPRDHVLTAETAHVEVREWTMRAWVVCHACEEGDPRETWWRLFSPERPVTCPA